ncbi:hypothetical protein LCGC14_1665050 [marine sediment metagenome]|uniref:Uncharacterized protein n=1 Tax=marine sediment metagenome TaxID=412755 RepID=A0A0F9K8U1_9ZZZZ
MVKRQKKNTRKNRSRKGLRKIAAEARKINASTEFGTCTEQLSSFGGLLAAIKFWDLLKFEEIFNSTYQSPERDPKLGHHLMVVGILIRLRRTVYRL